MYNKSLQKQMGCCNIDFAFSFVCSLCDTWSLEFKGRATIKSI